MPSFFCHECQTEGEDFPTDGDGSPRCPNCQSAFVEEIPPEDAGEAADDPRDFDPDDNPLANLLFGGGGAGGAGGGQGAGGQGGQPFFQFVTPGGGAGITFTAGGNGGGFTFQAGDGGAQGGGAGAGGGGLNPLTTAMLQAFGLAPPAQGFPPRAAGARRAREGEGERGEEAGDAEEEHAGRPHPAQGEGQGQQQGQGGRQQVPIRNLATFLGEAFGGPPPGPHPADHPDNNPFAEGGHERGQNPPPDENEQQQRGGPAAGGPLGSLFNLLSAFGLGPAQFGLAGNAGDYVFGEQNFQTLLNDLMEQAAGRAGPQPAPDDMIEKLPRVEITQELLDSDSITTCGICLDAFQLSETAIALPKCHHIYHQDCLVPWLKNSGTCPTCRDALVPQPGMEGYTGPTGATAGGDAAQAGEGGSAAAAASTSTSTAEGSTAPPPSDPTTASSSSSSAAEASTSSSSSSSSAPSRPSLLSRLSSHPSLSTTNPHSPSTARLPSIDGGSSLPGGWLWPSGTPDETEEVEEVDRMDVDEEPVRVEREAGEREKDPRGAAAEAAERRAREAREGRQATGTGTEVVDAPPIDDLD